MRKIVVIPTLIYFLLIFFAYFYDYDSPKKAKNRTVDEQMRDYIAQYADMAVAEMKRGKVPASITLAQGVLESKYGQSTLAVKANNHFGIKVGGADWKGGRYCAYTNEFNKKLNKMERKIACFRSYESAQEGFAHHSDFLISRPRYAGLFELDIRDYKGWAHGLEAAGYATDPQYGEKLVDIIERFELHKYDQR